MVPACGAQGHLANVLEGGMCLSDETVLHLLRVDKACLAERMPQGTAGASFSVSVGADGLGTYWYRVTPSWGLWPGPVPLDGPGGSTSNMWSQRAVAGLCNCPASAFVTISLSLFLEENSQNMQLTMLSYTSQRQLAHLRL